MPVPADKKALRAAFDDYDFYMGKLVATSKLIKEQSVPYWTARGYTVLPRLQRLRDSVFSDEG